jgi:dGTPase
VRRQTSALPEDTPGDCQDRPRITAELYRPGDRARVVSVDDPPGAYRTPFRRDYGRLLHSPAFRRLQGKTQLFPSHESDYFRNRLTHSLEVAQVAKSIAIRINATNEFFSAPEMKIDTDLVETAALAHDLGHPPFGHNGEEALDECMAESGGFEGNAQTLRILARLEKRQTLTSNASGKEVIKAGRDNRAGLNLTYRTLASVLKYDRRISELRKDRNSQIGISKGYYFMEANLVQNIKDNVGFDTTISRFQDFKTIECSIMDVADDIAYSTYDLDDSFKAGFLDPVAMLANYEHIISHLVSEIRNRLDRYYPDLPKEQRQYTRADFYSILVELIPGIYDLHELKGLTIERPEDAAAVTGQSARTSKLVASNGYFRHDLTSVLVGKFIDAIEVLPDAEQPWLSRARLQIDMFKRVETLKNFTYQAMIMSPRLKVTAYRGKDMVQAIFDALNKGSGELLMPDDFRDMYRGIESGAEKKRVVCDFIAGMTDRYAIEFYRRLYGTNPETIYSPL